MRLFKQAKKHLKVALGTLPSPVQHQNGRPFIFVHINKTGGTSVGNAIGLPVKSHQTARGIIKRLGRDEWDKSFKFTFVRNPWDRIVSLYKYRLKKNRTRIASHQLDFDQWIEKTIGSQQSRYYYDNPKSFQPQVDWLKDNEGKISIDFIGRFEQLESDFKVVRKELGLQSDLPHLNATSRTPYQTYFSERSFDTVSDWFKEDILTFDYQFDG